MRFLESTDLLKIEDILPFFPDFVVIDDFKMEICNALEEYSARIDELRAEMDEATASAEFIKRDIDGLANRVITVEQSDTCWKCGLALVTRQFYVFPCQHVFHADCLISMVSCPIVERDSLICLGRLWTSFPHPRSAGSSISRTSWCPDLRNPVVELCYLPHSPRHLPVQAPLVTAKKSLQRGINLSLPVRRPQISFSASLDGTSSLLQEIDFASSSFPMPSHRRSPRSELELLEGEAGR